ncbi:VQ motif-containing protein 22-like [Sesamum indicum]|uniref:VQ motif-containing protein 22-like n=1 Tax=Sesamum indicum TaxID=4182 RepID=A0A6I9UZ42_SESIN|nr:VQ motif-containing protein 22-like [Sesamum indicum]
MAVSHTMSNSSDWILQPYQSDFIAQTETPPSTVLTTTAAAAAASRNNNLIPDQGRVSKPLRRRSRASRRTPTTLLNTDTANFRAMVQQFTGAPAAPFANRPQLVDGGAALSFMEHIATTNANAVPGSGFHVQYIPSQMQQQQQHMFMVDNMYDGGGGDGSGLSTQAAAPGSENRGYGRSYML